MPSVSKAQLPAWKTCVKYCKACGKQLVIRNARDVLRRNFCSRSCTGQYTGQKMMEDPIFKAKFIAGGQTPESNRQKGHKGSAHPGWKGGKIERECRRCGVKFMARRYRVEADQARFCSQICYRLSGANGPALRLERKPVTCMVCGKISMVLPHRIHQKTCSRACSAVLGTMSFCANKGPTSIEKIIGRMLDAIGVEYIAQKWIGRICVPDFRVGNVLIFADGTYWHSKPGVPERDARINKKLKEEGYTVLRFSEPVINLKPSDVFMTLKEALCQQKV